MKNLQFPKIGLRNIKTALSVLICMIILPEDAFYAAIASVICMQSTVENSVKSGINRIIGTLIGGTLGVFFLLSIRYFDIFKFAFLVAAIGVICVIYICNFIKKPGSCSISCIVLIRILTAPESSDAIAYATSRTFETALGIIIAILVNKYFNPNLFKKLIPSNKR